jgi:hypothetical protein
MLTIFSFSSFAVGCSTTKDKFCGTDSQLSLFFPGISLGDFGIFTRRFPVFLVYYTHVCHEEGKQASRPAWSTGKPDRNAQVSS